MVVWDMGRQNSEVCPRKGTIPTRFKLRIQGRAVLHDGVPSGGSREMGGVFGPKPAAFEYPQGCVRVSRVPKFLHYTSDTQSRSLGELTHKLYSLGT